MHRLSKGQTTHHTPVSPPECIWDLLKAALSVLKDLASANNLCREAIVIHGGVPVLLQASTNGRGSRLI